MLSAEGEIKAPKGVIINQYLNIQFPGKDVEKISKSRGNAPWLEDYLNEGGDPDSMRYYLTMVAPEKARTSYRPDDMVQRHNSELANILGNFINRILTFTRKNIQEAAPAFDESKSDDTDRAFAASLKKCVDETSKLLEEFCFKAALERIMEFARECNRYVDERAPWKTRKTDLERTVSTITHSLWAIKALGVMLSPFMPTTGEKILRMLSVDPQGITWVSAAEPLRAGAAIEEPKILFEKIEQSEEVAK